jgi:hypothetical protein
MKLSSSISNLIFDELFSTIESIGCDKVIKTLQDAKLNSLEVNDLDIDFVITSVSNVASISKERIIYGKERTDERKMALALCVYFIKNEFFYSYGEMKKIFNKDESALSRYNSIVDNRTEKPKTSFDKTLDTYFKKINLLITEKKINNGK